jgi:hypothetical protein
MKAGIRKNVENSGIVALCIWILTTEWDQYLPSVSSPSGPTMASWRGAMPEVRFASL